MLVSARSRTVSLNALRWRARTPRLAFTAACVILSLIGLRVAIAGPARPSAAPPRPVTSMLDVDGFAEGFARAYLTVSPQDPSRRDRALKLYGYTADGTGSGTVATHV